MNKKKQQDSNHGGTTVCDNLSFEIEKISRLFALIYNKTEEKIFGGLFTVHG